MMGLSRCFTDWAARKLAFAALVVRSARTAMAARAAPAVRTKSPVDAECSKMLPSIRQTTEIKQMFATRETHWNATFWATNLLLSGTNPVSRLLIIMPMDPPVCRPGAGPAAA